MKRPERNQYRLERDYHTNSLVGNGGNTNV